MQDKKTVSKSFRKR